MGSFDRYGMPKKYTKAAKSFGLLKKSSRGPRVPKVFKSTLGRGRRQQNPGCGCFVLLVVCALGYSGIALAASVFR